MESERHSPSQSPSGRLIVISGPSGSGKSTLARRLPNDPRLRARLSISATTRRKRDGEVAGRDYFYLSQSEFAAKRDAGEFLEWAEVHGNSYGTPSQWVADQLNQGFCVILEIDVAGAIQVKQRMDSALLIFVHVGDMVELETRLRNRQTDDEATIQRRLANANRELEAAPNYDLLLLNDDLERAFQELVSVLEHHGCGCSSNAI